MRGVPRFPKAPWVGCQRTGLLVPRRSLGDQGGPAAHLGESKGFNTSDVPLEFMLHGEVAESFHARHRAQPDLGEELADVAPYFFALVQMNDVDLDSEIEQKITKNARRQYTRDSKVCLFGYLKAPGNTGGHGTHC